MTSRLRLPAFARTTEGAVGATMLLVVLVLCVVGPLLAPHPIDRPVGLPAAPPGGGHLLGTDALGRDGLSRVLHGGFSVIAIALAGTLLAYSVGTTIGLVAGYTRSIADALLMRSVDVMLSIPGLLLLLLLVTGLGPSVGALIGGIAVLHMPAIARVVRTTTSAASRRGFVEAAIARGDPTRTILRREILPNIAPVVIADFGVRFSVSVIIIASMNFLSLGLKPPAADWGLMIAENRDILTLNPWIVLVPAALLALLTIGINLVGDAYVSTLGRSGRDRRTLRAVLPAADAAA